MHVALAVGYPGPRYNGYRDYVSDAGPRERGEKENHAHTHTACAFRTLLSFFISRPFQADDFLFRYNAQAFGWFCFALLCGSLAEEEEEEGDSWARVVSFAG